MPLRWLAYPGSFIFFKNLPVYLNGAFFKKLESIIIPFVWGYKSHRIAKAHLYKPLKKGGLGLPNLKHYYWAANCRALAYWNCSQAEKEDNPSWLHLETSTINNCSLPSLLFSSSSQIYKTTKHRLTINNSIRILNQIKIAKLLMHLSVHPFAKIHPLNLDKWTQLLHSGERRVSELF